MAIDLKEGILYNLLFVLGFEIVILYNKSIHYEDAYWGERRGRARVEQEMRRIANVQLNTEKGFFVQPIGMITIAISITTMIDITNTITVNRYNFFCV